MWINRRHFGFKEAEISNRLYRWGAQGIPSKEACRYEEGHCREESSRNSRRHTPAKKKGENGTRNGDLTLVAWEGEGIRKCEIGAWDNEEEVQVSQTRQRPGGPTSTWENQSAEWCGATEARQETRICQWSRKKAPRWQKTDGKKPIERAKNQVQACWLDERLVKSAQ